MQLKLTPCLQSIELDEQNVCNLCQKKVYETSKMNKEEIINLSATIQGKICGKLPSNNLHTEYFLDPFKRFAFALIIVFGSTLFILDAKAQDSITAITKQLNTSIKEDTNSILIKGNLVNEFNEAFPFCNVMISYDGHILSGTQSDLDGNFTLHLDNYQLIEDSVITLSISSILSEKIDLEIDITESNLINLGSIEVKESAVEMLGMISIPDHKIIGTEPDGHRKTTFRREDIKRSPYRD